MKTLHTFNASSREQRVMFERLIRFASPGDSLLLLENGVYCITDAHALRAAHALGLALYALQPDLEARGLRINESELLTSKDYRCTAVDDAGFVQLCCQHHKVLNWCA